MNRRPEIKPIENANKAIEEMLDPQRSSIQIKSTSEVESVEAVQYYTEKRTSESYVDKDGLALDFSI